MGKGLTVCGRFYCRPGAPPPYDARYILRPETVESLFIAYRLTRDDKYRRYGWQIFEAIERHCRVEEGGYTTVLNVDAVPVEHEDKMETFLMVSACAFGPRMDGALTRWTGLRRARR